MKKYLGTSIILMAVALTVFGEYPELSEMKKWSRDKIKSCSVRLSSVDPKFSGVVSFGKNLAAIDTSSPVDVEKITVKNDQYWRASMEMIPADPSILFAHGHLLILNGEVDLAQVYFSLGSMFIEWPFKEEYGEWLNLRKKLLERQNKEIKKGTLLFDNGKYSKAIKIYDDILREYPNCGEALYEKGLTYMVWKGISLELRQEQNKDFFFLQCRKHNPFEWMAYQGSDQKVLAKLSPLMKKVLPFWSGEIVGTKGLADFSEGTEEIELYAFAAHSRWLLALLDKENTKKHLKKYLELMEKSGCPNMEFFKGQFDLLEIHNLKTDDPVPKEIPPENK